MANNSCYKPLVQVLHYYICLWEKKTKMDFQVRQQNTTYLFIYVLGVHPASMYNSKLQVWTINKLNLQHNWLICPNSIKPYDCCIHFFLRSPLCWRRYGRLVAANNLSIITYRQNYHRRSFQHIRQTWIVQLWDCIGSIWGRSTNTHWWRSPILLCLS